MNQQQMNQEQEKPGGINSWPMPFKIIAVVAVLAVLLSSIDRCEQKQDGKTSELSARPLDHGPHNRPVLGTTQKAQLSVFGDQQF